MKQTIQEYLGLPESWPVKEKIKHEIILMPNAQDIKNAKKSDPQACALHNTACRVFNIPNAAIGGRWAYIPQRDSKGRYYIARMQADPETQRALIKFDKDGSMPEFGFRFVPISPSHYYENKKVYMRKWSKKEVGHNQEPRGKLKKHRLKTRTIPMNVRASV